MRDQVSNLLAEADAAAQHGDWSAALGLLEEARSHAPEDPGLLSGAAICLLHLGRLEEAVERFEQVCEKAQDSPEAANNLGVALALAGQAERAEAAYRRALELDPEHRPAWKNLALLLLAQNRVEEGVPILAALVQTDPTDGEALALLADCYEEAGDLESAEDLYRAALRLAPEDKTARMGLARVQALRRPKDRIAGREHAARLARIKDRLRAANGQANGRRLEERPTLRVAVFGAQARARLALVVRHLDRHGWEVRFTEEEPGAPFPGGRLALLADPPASPDLLRWVLDWVASGGRLVLDLSMDPAQATDEEAAARMSSLLEAAAMVTVPSLALAERLADQVRRVEVVPEAWDRSNPMWCRNLPGQEGLTLGWLASEAEAEDLLPILEPLRRLLEKRPQVRLGIAGPAEALLSLKDLPQSRVRFVPQSGVEDLPYVLAHFDALLLPYRETPANRLRSDRLPMLAGARGIPWIGSPLPSYRQWREGGLIADGPSEWERALERLATQSDLRQRLAVAGREKAASREVGCVVERWIEVLRAAMAGA